MKPKFGICAPATVFVSALEDFSWDFLSGMALRAEELGYHSMWMADHLFSDNAECWTTLTAIGAVTKRLALGQHVMAMPFRPPSLLAKMAATLDYYTGGGRLIMGVGAGGNKKEFMEYGIPWRDVSRAGMAREAVTIMKRLWSEDNVNYRGKHYQIEDASMQPKPKKPIPIWIGGNSDKMLKIAGELGDGWIPGGREFDVKRFERIKEIAEKAGRDPSKITAASYVRVSFSTTEEEAKLKLKKIAKIREERGPTYTYNYTSQLPFSPDSFKEWIRKEIDRGVEYFAINFIALSPEDANRNMELFADEVMNEFKP